MLSCITLYMSHLALGRVLSVLICPVSLILLIFALKSA